MEKLRRRIQSLVNFSFAGEARRGPFCHANSAMALWLSHGATSQSTKPILVIKCCISSSSAFILQAASFDVITGASLSTLTIESTGSYLNFGLKLNNQVQSVPTDGPKMRMILCHPFILYIS